MLSTSKPTIFIFYNEKLFRLQIIVKSNNAAFNRSAYSCIQTSSCFPPFKNYQLNLVCRKNFYFKLKWCLDSNECQFCLLHNTIIINHIECIVYYALCCTTTDMNVLINCIMITRCPVRNEIMALILCHIFCFTFNSLS